jgi:single-strand DNA-binding protein
MNEVRLLGNLGADGELRYTQSGKAFLRLRVATEEPYQDGSGQWQSRAEWHTVVVWDSKAESLAPRCTKGRPVLVSGRLRTRSWSTDDGQSRQSTEVVASAVKVFEAYARRVESGSLVGPMDEGSADDIPF